MSDAIERWFVSGGWLYHEQPQLGRTGPNANAVLSLHDLTEEEQDSLGRALEALTKPADTIDCGDGWLGGDNNQRAIALLDSWLDGPPAPEDVAFVRGLLAREGGDAKPAEGDAMEAAERAWSEIVELHDVRIDHPDAGAFDEEERIIARAIEQREQAAREQERERARVFLAEHAMSSEDDTRGRALLWAALQIDGGAHTRG